jgi:serine/threonine protein kinase
VSAEAKDLIAQMLTVDPAQRPSAKQLLKHPWLAASPELLRTKGLGGTQSELKRWTAKRRLKAATRGIIAVRRMGGIMAGLKRE